MFAPKLIASCLMLTQFALGLEGNVQTHQSKSDATLVLEFENLSASAPTGLGLMIKLAPNWHTYWKNSGDSGAAPIIDVELPAGIEVSEIKYPTPKRIMRKDFTTFGYDGEVLLFRDLIVKDSALIGQTIPVGVKAEWLVCDDVCIPQIHDFYADITISSDTKKSNNFELFKKVRQELPVFESSVKVQTSENSDVVHLTVAAPNFANAQVLDFFPYTGSGIGNGQGIMSNMENGWKFEIPKATTEKTTSDLGVLVLHHNGELRHLELREVVQASSTRLWIFVVVSFLAGLFIAKFMRKRQN